MNVALYLRISRDPLKLTAGVDRQRVDCTNLARARWPDAVLHEYVDNDISASKYSRRASRPAFTRLCADIETGAIDAMVGWDFDRTFRQPRELEAFLDLADRVNFQRAVTAQGDVDLTSNDGKLHARIMVAVAAKESDDKSRRIRRAAQDRRERGLHHGSRVVYGYQLRDRVPVPVEPAASNVRQAAARVLTGESLQAVARWLRTVDPEAPATGGGVRKMLQSPTLVSRTTTGALGEWPALLTDSDYAKLLDIFNDERRRTLAPNGKRRWWLSGLVFCNNCRGPMRIRHDRIDAQGNRSFSYHCVAVDGRGCGRMSVKTLPLHRHVDIAMQEAVRLRRAPAPIPVQQDEDRLAELAVMYASGDLTRAEWDAARAAVPTRVVEVATARGPGPVSLPASEWAGLTVAQKHQRALDVIEAVWILPREHGGPRWQPSRVHVRWRE